MTKYLFTIEPNGGHGYWRMRVESDEPIQIAEKQYYTIVQEYSDATYTYQFYTVQQLNESEDIDTYYKWFQVKEYSCNVDRTPLIDSQFSKLQANLDYLSMMSGIDIPIEGEQE